MAQRLAYQRRFNRMAGGVSAVQDTAMTVTAFPRQVITHVAGRLRIEIKGDTVVDQPLHAMPGITGDKRDGFTVA